MTIPEIIKQAEQLEARMKQAGKMGRDMSEIDFYKSLGSVFDEVWKLTGNIKKLDLPPKTTRVQALEF